eukprot:Seg2420.4 transcript_id=Seg2420.4/GoldUCD/mRNA.D3Y31 product=Synaptotagmin-9 protein_id=Seg2420.4/GoldUCD/D3Y31
MSHDSNFTEEEEILLAVSIALGALFLATLITLIIARYFKQLKACWERYMNCCQATEDTTENERQIKRRHKDSKIPFILLGSDEKPFVIPGSIVSEKVQPELKTTATATTTTTTTTTENEAKPESDSVKLRRHNRSLAVRHSLAGLSEIEHRRRQRKQQRQIARKSAYSLKDINPFLQRRNALSKSEQSLSTTEPVPTMKGQIAPELYLSLDAEHFLADAEDSAESDNFLPSRGSLSSQGDSPMSSDDDPFVFNSFTMSLLDVRPELYDKSRKQSVGSGTLGKIKIALQYLDHDRTQLELFLQYMDSLQKRSGALGIYVCIMLLPERDNMYRSKMHQMTKNPVFEQSFVFKRTLQTGSFESKTIRFLIYCRHSNERRSLYGECSIALAGREIYGKIKTDIVQYINPPSTATEIGDMLIEIFYSEQNSLHVLVRTLKLAPTTSIDQSSAIHVKLSIKKKRRKVGRSATTVCPVPSDDEAYITVNTEIEETIHRNDFMEHSLHVVVSGKHRILGKKNNLGKVILGDDAINQTDNLHWQKVMTSQGEQLNLWHVVYGC